MLQGLRADEVKGRTANTAATLWPDFLTGMLLSNLDKKILRQQ